MERNVKYLLLRKTKFLKTSIFSERNLKNCTISEEQKGTRYIWGKRLYWYYRLLLERNIIPIYYSNKKLNYL